MTNEAFGYTDVPLPDDLRQLRDAGRFAEESVLIDKRLLKPLPDALRRRLEAEKRVAEMLPLSYPLNESEALELLRARVKDFGAERFGELLDAGKLDWIYINGERRFRRNLCGTLAAADDPLIARSAQDVAENELLRGIIRDMKKNGSAAYRVRVRCELNVKNAAPDELLRVWLPLAKPNGNVSEIKVLCADGGELAPENAPQRSVYFERAAKDGKEFALEYEFFSRARYIGLNDVKANCPQPDFCLDEQPPHIVKSRLIRELAAEIVGNERNALRKARLIYGWITENVVYSFMRPYFTVASLAEYAASNLKGDCGVQSLLFICLCRAAGVPATWESGSFLSGEGVGMHDWARFYVAPYGWLWADCSFGGAAYRQGDEERREFYFGNIDPLRIPANSAFQADFTPHKRFLRWDPFDNQCGEAETAERPLFPDDYDEDRTLLLLEREE